MAQQSPPIARAVAVLNFLGGHTGQAFTLTEISKALRISSATCHNLLGALTESGYVYRTAAKTYVLGPAVCRLAEGALAPELLMQVVRPEMRQLADEFDVVCSVFFLDGEKVIVRERAVALSHVAWSAPGKPVLSLTAPLGNLFLAWDEAQVDDWLNGANPALGAEARVVLRKSLEFVRQHRYAFGVRKVPLDGSERALELQAQVGKTDYALTEIDPAADYNLAYVAAPVFRQPDQVAFGLSLVGFDKPLKGAAVAAMGAKLRTVCDRLGDFLAGRAFPMP
ncbi:helix-turn-helix domain-containing protein [Caenibius sp. WL]|uniref:IclR family transcriptional regulator n=1 Tax=Caenibius sp. WL TaxID=2872646 RepID=UPI001C99EB52|nr:helix-turn-helix domain-containing protein [Caenibius sp. WL]QZP09058.1 helix-turn-helix domain-containing protein [Caenibius sp. WL]